MIHAYDNQCLGETMDYAVNRCAIKMDIFLELFIGTGYSEQFVFGFSQYV